MSKNNKDDQEVKFETFDAELNGVMTKFKVVLPNLGHQREAMKIRNRTFADAVESGALLKIQLVDIMKERGLWNDAKQKEYLVLESQILDGKDKIDKGGFKLNEAKELAFNMQKWRSDLIEMKTSESQLANETADGQADNASFNYLVSACVVYNDTGKPVFSGLDNYLNESTGEIAAQGARCLAALTYGVRSDIEKQLPENEFLLQYGFVDDELRLIDENGQLINEDGEEVDEDGFVVKEEKIEQKPFLDDEGNEVVKKAIEEVADEVVDVVEESVVESEDDE